MVRLFLGALAAALLSGVPAGAIPIDAPTSDWTLVSYAAAPDWADDQATGANEADIVGDAAHGALYTFFDDAGTPDPGDGVLGFRLRLGSDDNPGGFKHVAVVGLSVDGDAAVDVLLVVDNKGGSPEIAIRPVDGDGSSPAQTAIDTSGGVSIGQTAANYDWRAVSVLSDPDGTSTDVDGDGDTDYFLSYSVDFAQLVLQVEQITGLSDFDQSSEVILVAGTSTNSNSVNQDWAGPNGGTGSSQDWNTIGGLSEPRTVSAPEPSTALLLGLGLAALAGRSPSARRRA